MTNIADSIGMMRVVANHSQCNPPDIEQYAIHFGRTTAHAPTTKPGLQAALNQSHTSAE